MGLVDDDGELAPPVLVADGVQDERELLDGGDDDPLAILKQGAEMAGAFGMAHDRANLGEVLDGVPYLLVQYLAVRDDDGRIEERLAVLLQPDELVGQPRDRVRLAATRRVLNQILRADSPGGCVSQEPTHHVQLVVAGPYLLAPLTSGLVVPRLHDLSIVLDDVGEPVAGEDLLP